MPPFPFFGARMTVAFVLVLSAPLLAAGSAAAQTLPLSPDQWQINATGAFEGWTDRRDLLVLFHPWEVSQSGHGVSAEQSITIPADWTGPIRLHFYASDDYDGTMDPVTENWLGQVNLPGHRFKELLVNGAVVWRQDVADSADTGVPTRFTVALPDAKPGDTLSVAFRLVDEAGSMKRLPGDHRYIGTTDNIMEADPWKFMTHWYVGDVMLAAGESAPTIHGAMPSIAGGIKKPDGVASKAMDYPVTLRVRHGGSSASSRVLQCGVPFPRGVLHDLGQIQLKSTTGETIPGDATPMTSWDDGSVRFARVTAILPASCETLSLHLSTDPPEHIALSADTQALVEKNNAGEITLGFSRGESGLAKMRGTATIDGDTALLTLDDVRVIESGQLHQELEATGHLQSDTRDYGRCTLRITTFSGQPWARVFFRTFNDTPETLEVTRLTLAFDWSGTGSRVETAGHSAQGPRGRIAQNAENTWQWIDGGAAPKENTGAAPSWIGASGTGGSVVALVRHFAQQYPNALEIQDGAVAIELVSLSAEHPAYTPHEGEAKRFEIWLGLWDESVTPENMARFAESLSTPAGLYDAAYFCATGAFGNAAPYGPDSHPELAAFMQQTYGDIPASMFYHTGIRHFGDLPYNVDEGTWRNGYYDAQQGFFSAYLMSGDDRWFDHLEASVRHIIDVDICHASAAHPDWVGAIHGLYSKDHSTGDPWNPTQRTKGTFNYWRLTGDRDALHAALGVADSAVACNRAMGSVSVRDHAGVLYCLVAAYDETGEAKYLEAARKLAHDAITRLDLRRGCYAEIHGNYSYRGNVPWMVAQLMEPMYDYYRASGDVEAGNAVVGMAESILAENRTRSVPGDVYGYSHNPHFGKSSSYHILIAPAVLYAYELTGDPEFLKQGRAMYEQTIAEGTVNSVMNCFWNTHTLLYYLDRYADVETP